MLALRQLALTAALATFATPWAQAATVFADAFDAHSTAGFTLPSQYNSLVSLPTDSGGLGSAAQATWLKVDSLAGKYDTETLGLQLNGLVAGQTYTLGLQLFLGGSWDGSAQYYGPDQMRIVVNQPNASATTLLDATFANGQAGVNFGADSRQSYSPQTPLGGTALSFDRFTGASASYSLNQSGNYGQDYSIYDFSHGGTSPTLSFVAQGSSATINIQRLSLPSGDSTDEYWAVRNVTVTGAVAAVPEPSSVALTLAGLAVCAGMARRRR